MSHTLDGTLLRQIDGTWAWSDGTPEPRVRDMHAGDTYNYRCRTYGSGGTYVEVPLAAARREPDLTWVWTGVTAGRYGQSCSGDHTGPLQITEESVSRMRIEPGEDPLLGQEPIDHKRAIPGVALVPIAEWDAWSRQTIVGVWWDQSHEAEILAIAGRLGWRATKSDGHDR